MNQTIPLVDLKAQYVSIKTEIDNAINDCLSESNFIKGSAVGEFENDFARYLGADYCIGCGNGTDALEIILRSLNIGRGDEVLVPSLTWIATAEAVNNVGAEPVFVDINKDNFTIDAAKIEEKITSRSKAIIPVHLYGCPADMDEIIAIAGNKGLNVIEDCAQAHGAEYHGRKVGTFGIASAFSFFPSKNLGAFGDGGAVVTNNKLVTEKARMISNHGQLHTRHSHSLIGRNSRLDTIQASILKVKLKHLDIWNAKRIAASHYYKSKLTGNSNIMLPEYKQDRVHVFHLFVIKSPYRDVLTDAFDKKNISYGIHYPKALPFIEAYSYKNHKPEDFPESARVTNEIISLPLYPEITHIQIDSVCDLILNT